MVRVCSGGGGGRGGTSELTKPVNDFILFLDRHRILRCSEKE